MNLTQLFCVSNSGPIHTAKAVFCFAIVTANKICHAPGVSRTLMCWLISIWPNALIDRIRCFVVATVKDYSLILNYYKVTIVANIISANV